MRTTISPFTSFSQKGTPVTSVSNLSLDRWRWEVRPHRTWGYLGVLQQPYKIVGFVPFVSLILVIVVFANHVVGPSPE